MHGSSEHCATPRPPDAWVAPRSSTRSGDGMGQPPRARAAATMKAATSGFWMSECAPANELWLVSVMTVWIQAGVSYMLLRQQFKRRLVDVPRPPPAGVPATAESRG